MESASADIVCWGSARLLSQDILCTDPLVQQVNYALMLLYGKEATSNRFLSVHTITLLIVLVVQCNNGASTPAIVVSYCSL